MLHGKSWTRGNKDVSFYHLLIAYLFIPSLLYAKAGITICYVLWCLLGLWNSWKNRTNNKSDFQLNWTYGYLFIYMAVAISGIATDNFSVWLEQLKIYSPFLFLPIAFSLLPKFQKGDVDNLHFWLLIVMTVSSAIVGMKALFNIQETIQTIGLGQAVYTPIEHVKYSMFNAYGILSGIILYSQKSLEPFRKLIILCVIVLVIMIHILAVRTGLVIMYVGILSWVIVQGVRYKKWKKGLYLLGLVLSIFVATYVMVPTVEGKLSYMKYDWEMYRSGAGNNYSDSERWILNKASMKIFAEHPIIGIGGGDVKEVLKEYAEKTGVIIPFNKLPHSQFLLVLVRGGLLGLLAFLTGWLSPLLGRKPATKSFLLSLYLTFGLSFIVENSFERSMSVGFFLFFALLAVRTDHNISLITEKENHA